MGASSAMPVPLSTEGDAAIVADENGDVHVYFPVEIEVRAVPSVPVDMDELVEHVFARLARGIAAAK